MITLDRKVKVGKLEAYELDISSWLSTESLITLLVTDSTRRVVVVNTQVVGPLLRTIIKGVGIGPAELHFEYKTATRSNCITVIVNVIEER